MNNNNNIIETFLKTYNPGNNLVKPEQDLLKKQLISVEDYQQMKPIFLSLP